jgi:hypothetical protein
LKPGSKLDLGFSFFQRKTLKLQARSKSYLQNKENKAPIPLFGDKGNEIFLKIMKKIHWA